MSPSYQTDTTEQVVPVNPSKMESLSRSLTWKKVGAAMMVGTIFVVGTNSYGSSDNTSSTGMTKNLQVLSSSLLYPDDDTIVFPVIYPGPHECPTSNWIISYRTAGCDFQYDLCTEVYFKDEASMLAGAAETEGLNQLTGVRCEDREVPNEQKYHFEFQESGLTDESSVDGMCYSKTYCTNNEKCGIDPKDCE
mmetsp:Transcript_62317/g.69717  ORF Transcript_62317/g.69717 Transcript_62317/m.69717 type:complete len:193 (+) Transcript_62317:22-600(+)|eukprot:CAMPEP_0170783928 /NCGR_PEP_ID=MMETSP0733-20121128/15850_1 /TAXON_ID=186038 /ORGANISM="Fragilariopsis kerguelensis, Strain L26-C5" /LENGTH=192 /DNA_ID=CAMNT_0011128779 /DNA_START=59 /DNA_END=637 /DNA_ORIENTATION=-